MEGKYADYEELLNGGKTHARYYLMTRPETAVPAGAPVRYS